MIIHFHFLHTINTLSMCTVPPQSAQIISLLMLGSSKRKEENENLKNRRKNAFFKNEEKMHFEKVKLQIRSLHPAQRFLQFFFGEGFNRHTPISDRPPSEPGLGATSRARLIKKIDKVLVGCGG